MLSTLSIKTIFDAVDKLTAPIKKMVMAVKAFAKKCVVAFNRIERAERRVRQGIGKLLGKFGQLGLGLSALAIATQVATANIELDASLQSLQAITGVTGKQFKSFEKQLDSVSKSQKIFAADTAKAFELVGSAKPELLANAEALGKVTESALILAKAGKLEVTDSVNALTTALNQFGAGADQASKFVDILATAQQKGSGTIEYLREAIVRSGSTMKTFNVSFEDTIALLEGYAKAGIEASVSGTALSSIMGKLAKSQNKKFNPTYTKAIDIIDNLAKANLSYTQVEKLVGAQQAKNLLALINQNDIVQKLAGNLNEVGNAQMQAAIQSSSLSNKIKELRASFLNATTTTNSNNKTINKLKESLTFVADNMEKIISVTLKIIKAFLIYKAVMIGFGIALKVYSIVTDIASAAQWKFNIAASANPIGLIVIAIVAAIAAITLLVIKWKQITKWFKESSTAMKILLAPLIIANFAIIAIAFAIRKLIDNWGKLKETFSANNLKRFGANIIKFLLRPVVLLLKLLEKVPGKIGKFAKGGIEGIEGIGSGIPKKPLNPDVEIEKVRTEKQEKTVNNKIGIEIMDKLGLSKITENTGNIPINLTSTVGL